MLRFFAALLVAAFATLASAAPSTAGGGERVLSYRSDIEVAADASLHVTETIRVEAEGREIRHGLYRDFPTVYDRGGQTITAGFTVDGVERDGHSEPWRREAIEGGVRIRIGDADREIPPGEHSYVIRYTTTRQLDLSDPNFDALYWNVTGNGWALPIDSAEAHVRLPRAVRLGPISIYTGPAGAQGGDAEIVSQVPGEVLIRTTKPLAEGEGLTISVRWPKGIVSPMSTQRSGGL